VHELLGGQGVWAPMPTITDVFEVDEDGSRNEYSVLTGEYGTGGRWESTPVVAGTPLATPTPVFRKLDPSVVDEELARLDPSAERM
jgi:methionyl-tRNA synthetase